MEAKDISTKTRLLANLDEVVASAKVAPVDGITAAGQPDHAAFKVFADSGYTTVIDLRGAQENRGLDEPAIVEDLGMVYVHMPIVAAHEISFDNAAKLDALIDESKGPVLVHCASSDRVGALLALRKSLAGAKDESAMSHGMDGGLSGLAGAVQGVLNSR